MNEDGWTDEDQARFDAYIDSIGSHEPAPKLFRHGCLQTAAQGVIWTSEVNDPSSWDTTNIKIDEPAPLERQYITDAAWDLLQKSCDGLGRDRSEWESARKRTGTMLVTVAEWDELREENERLRKELADARSPKRPEMERTETGMDVEASDRTGLRKTHAFRQQNAMATALVLVPDVLEHRLGGDKAR